MGPLGFRLIHESIEVQAEVKSEVKKSAKMEARLGDESSSSVACCWATDINVRTACVGPQGTNTGRLTYLIAPSPHS